jgi:hypothetical protein
VRQIVKEVLKVLQRKKKRLQSPGHYNITQKINELIIDDFLKKYRTVPYRTVPYRTVPYRTGTALPVQ